MHGVPDLKPDTLAHFLPGVLLGRENPGLALAKTAFHRAVFLPSSRALNLTLYVTISKGSAYGRWSTLICGPRSSWLQILEPACRPRLQGSALPDRESRG